MTIELDEITNADELSALLGQPTAGAREKTRSRLHALDREWLAASPLVFVATSAADGTCDVSPKGDPPGSILVLDDATIVVAERPGNRRADGFHNIFTNPRVGLIFLIPGRGDTLRVNGRARLIRDSPFFDRLTVEGHRPRLAVLVHIEEVFHHCSKAFMRAGTWDPATWRPDAVASRAVIAGTLERPKDSLEDLERYYGPSYAERLYR